MQSPLFADGGRDVVMGKEEDEQEFEARDQRRSSGPSFTPMSWVGGGGGVEQNHEGRNRGEDNETAGEAINHDRRRYSHHCGHKYRTRMHKLEDPYLNALGDDEITNSRSMEHSDMFRIRGPRWVGDGKDGWVREGGLSSTIRGDRDRILRSPASLPSNRCGRTVSGRHREYSRRTIFPPIGQELYVSRTRIQRDQSEPLPFLSRSFTPNMTEESHPYDDREYLINHPTPSWVEDDEEDGHRNSDSQTYQLPRIVELPDNGGGDDRMSIDQEPRRLITPPSSAEEEEDSDSVTTILTIRSLPEFARSGGQDVEERDRTAALFEILEEICVEAARKYWGRVVDRNRRAWRVVARRVDIPNQGMELTCGSQPHEGIWEYSFEVRRRRTAERASSLPIRTRSGRERWRGRGDPYPTPNYHAHRYDEDTSMSPPSSPAEQTSRQQRTSEFMHLITKISNHVWENGQRSDSSSAAFLAAGKCWDLWRLAWVVVFEGVDDGGGDGVGEGVVRKIISAAGELCGILGDVVGRDVCEGLFWGWVGEGDGGGEEGSEEGEILG